MRRPTPGNIVDAVPDGRETPSPRWCKPDGSPSPARRVAPAGASRVACTRVDGVSSPPVRIAFLLVVACVVGSSWPHAFAGEPDAGVQAPAASKKVVAPRQTKSPQSKRKPKPNDAGIRRQMIRDSIAAYSGSCPCPYNTARNGARCGGWSAYSRPGGAAPLCYPTDISDEMVEEYRKAHPEE